MGDFCCGKVYMIMKKIQIYMIVNDSNVHSWKYSIYQYDNSHIEAKFKREFLNQPDKILYIEGSMQERCNSIANALELHLSCTNPSIRNWACCHWIRIALRKDYTVIKYLFIEYCTPGVGGTKPIFSVPLFSTFSVIVKTNVSYWISRSYLAGVAAAQLQRHLSNMNVIQVLLQDQQFCLRRN